MLLAIAVLMPAMTALGSWVATLYAGPEGLLQTYQFQLCRRGNCLGDGIQRGPSEVSTAGAMLGLPWIVAAVGLGLSLLLRRRGWMTVPLTIVHALFALTMWNQIASAMAGGAWWGQIILVVFVLGLPLAMMGLGELAIPVDRTPKALTPEQVALAQSDATMAAQASRAPAWQPPPAADPGSRGSGRSRSRTRRSRRSASPGSPASRAGCGCPTGRRTTACGHRRPSAPRGP